MIICLAEQCSSLVAALSSAVASLSVQLLIFDQPQSNRCIPSVLYI